MPARNNDRRNRVVQLDNVELIYRNFRGQEKQYNAAGQRNFCVLLDEKTAAAMAKDRWNVKVLDQNDEEGLPEQPFLPVAVNFKNRPPKIVMITSRGRTFLDEDLCEQLDYADIVHCDLLINPSEWGDATKGGIKAYLEAIYVTVEEDALEKRYGDLPIAGRVPRQED